jgi:hypothetical protein
MASSGPKSSCHRTTETRQLGTDNRQLMVDRASDKTARSKPKCSTDSPGRIDELPVPSLPQLSPPCLHFGRLAIHLPTGPGQRRPKKGGVTDMVVIPPLAPHLGSKIPSIMTQANSKMCKVNSGYSHHPSAEPDWQVHRPYSVTSPSTTTARYFLVTTS